MKISMKELPMWLAPTALLGNEVGKQPISPPCLYASAFRTQWQG